jgi:hypothetical protein
VSFPKLFPFLWRLFASAIGGVVFVLQHFTLLKAPMTCFKWAFYSLFLMLFVKLHPPFLWLFCNFLQIGLAKQGLGFMVNSPMLFIFILFFCKFKWWCRGHLATPNIVENFTNNIFLLLKKKGVLQLGLQLSFWDAMTIYNLLYFYIHECYWTNCMNCKACNSPYIRSHSSTTHCSLVPILSQQLFFN